MAKQFDSNHVKVRSYEVLSWPEAVKVKADDGTESIVTRQFIIIYAQGEDGNLYEMSGGKWAAMPILKNELRSFLPPKEDS